MRILSLFIRLFRSPQGTGQGVVRGGTITLVQKLILKPIELLRTFAVARLLFPEDVGLFALAALAMSVTESFFQTGFSPAIVQSRGEVEKDLNSAWTVKVIRGAVLAGLLGLVVAPLSASFFDNPAIIPLVRALGLVVFIAGLENPGMALLNRELRFNRVLLYNICGVVVRVGTIIIAALLYANPWALVAGAVAGTSAFTLISYALHPYRPRLVWDFTGALRLFRFGKWVWLGGFVGFLVNQGDHVFVGKLLDAESLAFYSMSFGLGMLPAFEIVKSFGGVLFPVYARLQGDSDRLRGAFVRVARLLVALAIPASVGLYVMSEEIIGFIYGSRWLPMIPILQVIVLIGFVRALQYLMSPLFMGIGRPQMTTMTLAIQSSAMFVFIVPLVRMYGTVGAAWAALVGAFLALAYLLFRLDRDIRVRLRSWMRIIGVPLVSSMLMAVFLFMTAELVPVASSFMVLVHVGMGVVVYLAVLALLDRYTGAHMRRSLEWVLENR